MHPYHLSSFRYQRLLAAVMTLPPLDAVSATQHECSWQCSCCSTCCAGAGRYVHTACPCVQLQSAMVLELVDAALQVVEPINERMSAWQAFARNAVPQQGLLIDVLRVLHARSQRFWAISLSSGGHMTEVQNEHELVVDALEQGDSELAQQAISDHVLSFRNALINARS